MSARDPSTLVRRAAVSAAPAPSGAFSLVVVEGVDVDARVTVDGTRPTRILVGTGAACELRLRDRLVSRRHLGVEVAGSRLRLSDLGSTNGTNVAGVDVVEALLHGGELVRIGETLFRVDALGEERAAPQLSDAMRFGAVVGGSAEMRRLYPLCERIAAANVPVILEGETGTGKEVLAEAIHDASSRARAPFVVFDCTAVPPTLMESALFGHERGAFTGATSARRGVFEQADGGTLLIDEIGELDPPLQPKLLRAIERGEVQRVGSETWTRVDVRVIAATRRDLDREIQEGRFRDDLFFRLAVGRIELPPLRRRRGDVSLLARHFWRQLGGDTAGPPGDFLARLEAYDWPGNVRELHNAVARRIALGELAPIAATKPSPATPRAASGPPSASPPGADPIDAVLALDLPLAHARARVVDELESRYVARVLERHGGNVNRAAAASGLKRRYFQVLKARHTK